MIIPFDLTIKFGGGTLKDKKSVNKTLGIIKKQKPAVVVVSAPGTDGVYNRMTEDLKEIARLIEVKDDRWTNLWKERIYNRLTKEFDFNYNKLNLISLVNKFHGDLNQRTYDEIVSLGEHFMAQIIADQLRYDFVDTMDCAYVDVDGNILEKSYQSIAQAVAGKKVVMAGFSANYDGGVKLLPAGGSDIMGVVMAKAANTRFKRITEKSMRVFDPKYGNAPLWHIGTFEEVGQTATLNEHIIHPVALRLAEDLEIPVEICSFEDSDKGLRIVYKRQPADGEDVATISCQEDLVALQISKLDLERYKQDFQFSLYQKLKHYGLREVMSFTSKTRVTLLIPEDCLTNSRYPMGHIQSQLGKALGSDWIAFEKGWTLISLVGVGMCGKPGILAKYTAAIQESNISIEAVQSPLHEGVIYFGFKKEDFPKVFEVLKREAFPEAT